MTDESVTVTGVLLDEEERLTLVEFARACSVHAGWVLELVEEGIIEPAGREPDAWRFGGASLARARRAARLERDLGINLAGIALALDLIDELESLRERLRALGEMP